MKLNKKILGGLMVAASAFTLASCGGKDVFHIYAWNDEFKGFFDKYVSDEKEAGLEKYHLDGVEVKWTITPSDNGAYQEALDLALKNNVDAKRADKIDMFLAEADYIKKYADASVTQDVTKLGVTDFTNIYNYTKEAASDSKGVVKGVSFQCCPSGLIYNRVVAKDVLGTDDPAIVNEALNSWEKFNAVAVLAKAKGYYMTACEAETYRVFSNNATTPWVDANDNLKIPEVVETWMTQAELYVKSGFTVAADVWAEGKTANIKADANKALCCFGPAWYYNFCMSDSKKGDWGIVEGPMAHFWGGTWLLAPTGADNPELVAKTMNAFINDEEVCTNLIKNDGQFTNNQKVNSTVANSSDFKGNEFLGGQNDTKMFLELAKDIKFQNTTIYDQLCNEGIQKYFREYLDGTVDTKEKAIENFYTYIKGKYPNLKTPA